MKAFTQYMNQETSKILQSVGRESKENFRRLDQEFRNECADGGEIGFFPNGKNHLHIYLYFFIYMERDNLLSLD